MAQHDYTIANQGFPAFRSDLNDALAAIVSNNSGATEPTTMFAHQMWVDTAANPSILKIRNADNDAWITIGSIDQTGDTFTLVNLRTSGPVVFNDAGADVDFRVEGDTNANLLFVDASADAVGIGTSGPLARFESRYSNTTSYSGSSAGTSGAVIRNAHNSGGSNQYSQLSLAVTGDDFTSNGQVNLLALQESAATATAAFVIQTRNAGTFAERMRIDSSGNVLVNTQSQIGSGRLSVKSANDCIAIQKTGATGWCIANLASTANSGVYQQVLFQDSGGEVGKITSNGTNTTYATSSDYRLKENITPIQNALDKITQLNPVNWTWKSNGSAGQGFIAHELQAVVPDAVTGEKDATEIKQVEVSPAVPATYDEEGNELTPAVEAVYEEREVPKYQGVDTSFLVATLTAAIKELKAELDAAKERIAALENA